MGEAAGAHEENPSLMGEPGMRMWSDRPVPDPAPVWALAKELQVFAGSARAEAGTLLDHLLHRPSTARAALDPAVVSIVHERVRALVGIADELDAHAAATRALAERLDRDLAASVAAQTVAGRGWSVTAQPVVPSS